MEYWVVFPDGQRFGPASLRLLNEWATEYRVLPDTIIETGTGDRIFAQNVPGLNFPPPPQAAPAPTPPNTGLAGQGRHPGGPYVPLGQRAGSQPAPQMPYQAYGFDDGQVELKQAQTYTTIALVSAFLSAFCCGSVTLAGVLFIIGGYVNMNRAAAKGNPHILATRNYVYLTTVACFIAILWTVTSLIIPNL